MKLKDKKFLAEWMGFKTRPSEDSFEIFFDDRALFLNDDYRNRWIWELHWNPDTDHKQFAEVWIKLSYDQKISVKNTMVTPTQNYSPTVMFADRIIFDLPEVMVAVLEVLKGGE